MTAHVAMVVSSEVMMTKGFIKTYGMSGKEMENFDSYGLNLRREAL
jgi:hypothetical protein